MDEFVLSDDMHDALRRLDSQMEFGYVDIDGFYDRDEFAIVEKALKDFKQKYCKRETINHEQN